MRREYEVEYQGAKIKCNSLQAVLDLLRELKVGKHPHHRSWAPDEFTDFTNRLEFQPKRLLAFLSEKGSNRPVTDEELRKHIGLASNKALAGVLSGITKIAKAFDIEPERVYTSATSYSKGKPLRLYYVNGMFQRAAEQHDWPTPEEVKEWLEPDYADHDEP